MYIGTTCKGAAELGGGDAGRNAGNLGLRSEVVIVVIGCCQAAFVRDSRARWSLRMLDIWRAATCNSQAAKEVYQHSGGINCV